MNDISVEYSTLVEGANFSGRSAYLRARTAELASLSERRRHLVIPSAVLPALSGLTNLTDHELRVHGPEVRPEEPGYRIDAILETDRIRNRAIHTLSGGELVRLVTGAALRQRPALLAIDCALEQIDAPTRKILFEAIAGVPPDLRLLLADNRSDEVTAPIGRVFLSSASTGKAKPLSAIPAIEGQHERRPVELVCEKITFGYKRRAAPVLRDVTISLTPGTIYFLQGPNGAGKSTFARLLCGAHAPWSGRLVANGRKHEPSRTGNSLIAYHFQNPDLGRVRSSLRAECTFLRGRLANTNTEAPAETKRAIDTWITAFGMHALAEDSLLGLPFVLRKRADLCACLASGASWLILDEPTLGQDAHTVEQVAAMIRQLARDGAGIIIISHAPRLGMLVDGEHLRLDSGQLIDGDYRCQ